MTRFDFLHDARPHAVERLLSLRLPRQLYAVTAVSAAIFVAFALTGTIESLRIRSAAIVERRAEQRFEASRDALADERLAWQQLDALIVRDRRLRDIRLSGTKIAARIAHVGNAFPQRAWVKSLTAGQRDYGLKGLALDLAAVERTLANLVTDRALTQPRGGFLLSRQDAGRSGTLAFELRADSAR
ncbi:MAG: hypothetical protein WB615_05775 [Candidatus Tumulicola sp.]